MGNELLYEGKAKKVFKVEGDESLVYIEYKDSLTAFNALKNGSFPNKGKINKEISVIIFKYLEKNGVNTHFISELSETTLVAHKVNIIPIEVVVRNIVAGSLSKKFSFKEGLPLKRPIVEFYYKNDILGDPFINDDHVLLFELMSEKDIADVKLKALKINELLKRFFLNAQLLLIDFKLEFGKTKNGQIILADEISPDCCRLWDKTSKEKMDKDRFRQDMGLVAEKYQEVLNRLKSLKI